MKDGRCRTSAARFVNNGRKHRLANGRMLRAAVRLSSFIPHAFFINGRSWPAEKPNGFVFAIMANVAALGERGKGPAQHEV
jgi:hypothetical protein